MTHEELLARIEQIKFVSCDENADGIRGQSCNQCLICQGMNALRAVVELHKPFIYEGRFHTYERCGGCSSPEEATLGNPYPCPTIQTIEAELK